jgi:hypothetical protein
MNRAAESLDAADPKVKSTVKKVRKIVKSTALSTQERQLVKAELSKWLQPTPAETAPERHETSYFTKAMTVAGGGLAAGLAAVSMVPSLSAAIIGVAVGGAATRFAQHCRRTED